MNNISQIFSFLLFPPSPAKNRQYGHNNFRGTRYSVEHDGFVAIQKHPLLRPPFDRRCQHLAFDIAAFIHQLLRRHAVIHSRNPLLDDRAFVEVGGDKVGSGADNLDSALECLVVRLRALEGRQEAVVNVDDLARHGFAEFRGEDLHIPCQNDEIDVVFLDQFQNTILLLDFVVFGHWQVVEVDVVALGQGFKIRMIGYNQGDIDAQLARLLSEEQVVQAMSDLGNHDQHFGLLSYWPQVVVHLDLAGQLIEGWSEKFSVVGRAKMYPHEKPFRRTVTELLQVEDIQAVLRKDGRHGVDDTWLVRT